MITPYDLERYREMINGTVMMDGSLAPIIPVERAVIVRLLDEIDALRGPPFSWSMPSRSPVMSTPITEAQCLALAALLESHPEWASHVRAEGRWARPDVRYAHIWLRGTVRVEDTAPANLRAAVDAILAG